jgi:hypothetical protein
MEGSYFIIWQESEGMEDVRGLVEEARKEKENGNEREEELPEGGGRKAGTCFTCFTGTNVLALLVQKYKRGKERERERK